MVAFGNVKHQIFKELFLSRVCLFVKDSNGKEINNETCSCFLFLFCNLVISKCHGSNGSLSCFG